jgi:hypothetical protein
MTILFRLWHLFNNSDQVHGILHFTHTLLIRLTHSAPCAALRPSFQPTPPCTMHLTHHYFHPHVTHITHTTHHTTPHTHTHHTHTHITHTTHTTPHTHTHHTHRTHTHTHHTHHTHTTHTSHATHITHHTTHTHIRADDEKEEASTEQGAALPQAARS